MASFEESLLELERIVDRMEKGDLPLEEAMRLFEKGIEHSNACKAELDAAEGKVQILLKQKDGGIKASAMQAIAPSAQGSADA